jgi:hypothetical protein
MAFQKVGWDKLASSAGPSFADFSRFVVLAVVGLRGEAPLVITVVLL